MTANNIRIPRRITNELLHLAQLSPTKEVCGLVGSKAGIPHRCYPVDNIAECPEQRFLLDAQQQIQAMTTIRERGEDFFAIFHSHPTSPAIPSETDIK
ncbi:MAG: M67 family metallopeptidase, partial [Methylococcales bacterium]|nr:M67 family metallopeptidase [Methylococcales bacterium]